MTIITLSPRFEPSSLGRPTAPGNSSKLTGASCVTVMPNLHSNTLSSAEAAKAEREFWALRRFSDSRQDLLVDKYVEAYGFPFDGDFDGLDPDEEAAGFGPSPVPASAESQPHGESAALQLLLSDTCCTQARGSLRTAGTERRDRIEAGLRKSAQVSQWIFTATAEAFAILQLWIL